MPPFFSFLLFLLFFNKKCKPLLDKPQTPGGSSIWIIEDHCVFLYSAIWAFLRFADTCVFYTQNASSLSKVWCMWDSWSQRCHVTEIVLLDFLFFNSLPTRCSGSPVGVLLFLLFLFRSHFPAVLPLILYGLLPLWPGVGAEGTFSLKSKAFSTTIRSLILDPWSLAPIFWKILHIFMGFGLILDRFCHFLKILAKFRENFIKIGAKFDENCEK